MNMNLLNRLYNLSAWMAAHITLLIKQTIQSLCMDGGAYHAACCRCGCLGIICACVILMDSNLRGDTDAGRRDVRHGTNLEAIRFQAGNDAPEGYPRGRAGTVFGNAIRCVVPVPFAQSAF